MLDVNMRSRSVHDALIYEHPNIVTRISPQAMGWKIWVPYMISEGAQVPEIWSHVLYLRKAV